MSSDYPKEFYSALHEGALRSARQIVPLVVDLIHPRSVIDVGCGTGTWLSVFRELGATDVLGIDGDYVAEDLLEIPKECFRAVDLHKTFQVERTFDLVVSVEVGEHLAPESAADFVHALTQLGPVILFSAAIPFQGGVHHVNEQWPDYWAHYFAAREYVVVDAIRPRVWQNEEVEFWYAQNILLFVRRDYLASCPSLANPSNEDTAARLSIVHPKPYVSLNRKYAAALQAYTAASAEAVEHRAKAVLFWQEGLEQKAKAEFLWQELMKLKGQNPSHLEPAGATRAETAEAIRRKPGVRSPETTSYMLADIELTAEFPSLSLPQDKAGLGLLVRCNDRPVAFIMNEATAGETLTPQQLTDLVRERIGPAPIEAKTSETVQANLPSMTVAICTKDHPVDLARCLGELLKLRNTETDFDILVIDNAPSDERTRSVVESLPKIRYVMEPKPGLNFARNRALQEATGDWLVFIDDDVTVDRIWLRGFRKAIGENPDLGGVTGLVLPAQLETEAQILFERRGGFEKNFKTTRYTGTMPGHPFYPCVGGKFGTGCNMAFLRRVLLELGGFDEALDTGSALPGGGDTDMLYRVVRAGYPLIYEPEFLVYHRHRREYEQLRRQYCYSWAQGLMAFAVKSYRSDVAQRPNLRRMVLWWFRSKLGELGRSLIRQNLLAPDIVLAELYGGIFGLVFAYPRSLKRTEEIRKRYQ